MPYAPFDENKADFFVLYNCKIYHCSEVTTEASLYCAITDYGHGATLFFLDELDCGQYVDANDCLQVSPNFFLHLRHWVLVKFFTLKLKVENLFFRSKCLEVPFDEF